MLDEQAQKVRDSLRATLIGWARQMGEGIELYRQCAHAMPAPGRPLVRSAQHAPQRHAAVTKNTRRGVGTGRDLFKIRAAYPAGVDSKQNLAGPDFGHRHFFQAHIVHAAIQAAFMVEGIPFASLSATSVSV